MSRHRVQESEVRSQNSECVRRRSAFCCLLLAIGCLSFLSGCRMDMQDQPKYKAYRKGSIRKPVAGTVPRGYLREDKHLYTGKKDQPSANPISTGTPQVTSPGQQSGGPNVSPAALYADDVDSFPFAITEPIVKRGEERFNAFCSMCHGPTGYGDGMIVRRGFRAPPSYHQERLQLAPVGHFFDVITNGWGAMPSHAAMIPVTDRWAIVAYIRALQLSQNPQGGTVANRTSEQPKPSPTPRAESRGRR